MKADKQIIYQTFPRLFGNYTEYPVRNGSKEVNGCGKFNSYTVKALAGIQELGITHIWYTGVLAHSTGTDYSSWGIPSDHQAIVKGKAGSPYAIKDYYDVDPDLAERVSDRMNEFVALVRRTHDAGMKVIIDFVPNHVSRSYRSLMKPVNISDIGQDDNKSVAFSPFNNFYYLPGQTLNLHLREEEVGKFYTSPYPLKRGNINSQIYTEFPAKVTGNDCFTANPGIHDWYDTVKLNYGVDYLHGGATYFSPIPDTWHKMLHILLYWVEKDIDGFRCDMAEMVPISFWSWAIPQVKKQKNVLFIAEIYNPSRYQEFIQTGRFDFLYDKSGVYDLLRDIMGRQSSIWSLKEHLQRVEPMIDSLLFFLENHDEQRIASNFFAGDALAAIPALIFMMTYRTNPVMIYNGQEVGEKGMDNEGFSGLDGKTSIFDYWRMDSIRRWANVGCFDGGLLNETEKSLRLLYKRILTLAVEEKALSMGLFYSLDNTPDQVLAFLRKYGNELILVSINFSKHPIHTRIKIPKEAFDILQIPDNKVSMMKELLSDEENICSLTHTCPFQTTLSEQSAKIYKLTY